jgi:hypothetical protein
VNYVTIVYKGVMTFFSCLGVGLMGPKYFPLFYLMKWMMVSVGQVNPR